MRKGNKTLLFTTLALLLVTGSATAQQQKTGKHEFSLQQAVDYGMKNAVQVKNALLDIAIQQQSNRDITSAALPQVTSTSGLVLPDKENETASKVYGVVLPLVVIFTPSKRLSVEPLPTSAFS